MSLKDRLAFDALRNDIAELCLALEKHNCSWNGKSWKFPNQSAKLSMRNKKKTATAPSSRLKGFQHRHVFVIFQKEIHLKWPNEPKNP